jgi:hypothetical protein
MFTQEQFDEALQDLIDESPASALLAVPGVYEAVSECFNNEVIDALSAKAGVCPDCGAELNANEQCPDCGWTLEDQP